ncbi:MAG: hypothetical protein PWP27_1736 [Clostridiales bacterium]|jgi:hypothetical protein|nr:hypothetical protein [Clostridiales bacterium]
MLDENSLQNKEISANDTDPLQKYKKIRIIAGITLAAAGFTSQ